MMSRAPIIEHAKLGRDALARIGQQLRAMYAELIDQEVPEKLRELVRRLSTPETE
jgi:hypothetical protein